MRSGGETAKDDATTAEDEVYSAASMIIRGVVVAGYSNPPNNRREVCQTLDGFSGTPLREFEQVSRFCEPSYANRWTAF